MILRLLLDQNVPAKVCEFLRIQRPEWTVLHVGDIGLSRAPDSEILTWAQPERWIIVTYDEDFADTRMFPVGSHAGVVRLRVWPSTIEETEAALGRLVRDVRDEDLPGSLIIIDSQRIRVRRSARHG